MTDQDAGESAEGADGGQGGARAARRSIARRSLRILLEVVGIAVAGLAVLAVLAAWRLSQDEPVRLGFLTPYIERALVPADGSFAVKIDDTLLTWEGWERTVDLHAMGVHVVRPDGQDIAAVPEMAVTLSVRALLDGFVAPTSIELIGLRLFAERTAEGLLRFIRPISAAGETTPEGGADMPALLLELSRPPDRGRPTGFLRRVTIVEGEVTLIDRPLGITWHALRAEIALQRDRQGISGSLALSVDVIGDPATLNTTFTFDSRTQRIGLDARFDGVKMDRLALVVPAAAAMIDAKLTYAGTLAAEFGLDGTIGAAEFVADSGSGSIRVPGGWETPFAVIASRVRLAVDGAADRIELKEATFQTEGPKVTVSGTATGLIPATVRREGLIEARLTADRVLIADLDLYWPQGVAKNARRWVLERIPEGRAEDFEALARVRLPVDAAPVFESVTGGFNGRGVSLRYLEALPAIRNAAGKATFTKDNFEVEFAGGESEGLAIIGGRLRIAGFKNPDKLFEVEGTIEGSLADTLKYLGHPSLRYASKMGIPVEGVGGRVRTRLKVNFYVYRNLTIGDVNLSAEAEIAEASVRGAVFGRDLSNGRLDLDLDNLGMTISGTASIAGVPARLRWVENFKPAAFQRQITVSGQASTEQRAALGFDFRPYVDGPIASQLTYTQHDARRANLTGTFDLSGAALALPFIEWQKPAGTKGTAQLTLDLQDEKPVALRGLEVSAGTLSAKGTLGFGRDGSVASVDLAKLRFDRTDLEGVSVRFYGAGVDIKVEGGEIDAGPLLRHEDESRPDEPRRPFAFSGALRRVLLEDGQRLDKVSAVLRRSERYWEDIALDATLAGGKTLTVRYRPDGSGKHALKVATDDAGSALRTFGLIDSVIGGRLSIVGRTVDKEPDRPLTGKAEIKDFRVVGSPLLARLLTIATLTGLVDVLTGEGFLFTRFSSEFTKTGGRIDVKKAAAHGPSIGLTADGIIDTDAETMDLDGTVAPAYVINSILNRIPLIGEILQGGEGEALFAATYTARGPLAQPEISVNPLAALAPGFFREFIELLEDGGPKQTAPLPNSSN